MTKQPMNCTQAFEEWWQPQWSNLGAKRPTEGEAFRAGWNARNETEKSATLTSKNDLGALIRTVGARIPNSVTPETRIEIHPSEWLMLVDALDDARVTAETKAPLLMDCPKCGGSGFSTAGSGYGNVCDECGGQRQMPAPQVEAGDAVRATIAEIEALTGDETPSTIRWVRDLCLCYLRGQLKPELPAEPFDDEAHSLASEFDRLLDNTLVPNEPLEVYSSNSYRRVGLKSRYHEVLYASRDRSDGHPNFSNYALLDALVCAFNAMLARRAVKTNGDVP